MIDLRCRPISAAGIRATQSDPPFGCVLSAGQVALVPVQYSAMSHLASIAGLHTCVVGANEQDEVQQDWDKGSQTAPCRNLQAVRRGH